VPLSSITAPLPSIRYASTEDEIERVAPHGPGIIFFWDKRGDFWFVQPQADIKSYLLLIRGTAGHVCRQGVEFAFEEWPDPIARESRWHYALDHLRPTGQQSNLASAR
jgi:hypothetical protein